MEKPGLPLVIKKVIEPIFSDLSKDELLENCVHGKTQNNNEAINAIIWKKIPKDVFVGRKTLEIGISSAITNFNDGTSGFLEVLKNLNLLESYFTKLYARKHDIVRIKESDRKSTAETKSEREKLNAKRKHFGDKEKEKEG